VLCPRSVPSTKRLIRSSAKSCGNHTTRITWDSSVFTQPGSFTSILECPLRVRFPPDSDRTADMPRGPSRANNGHIPATGRQLLALLVRPLTSAAQLPDGFFHRKTDRQDLTVGVSNRARVKVRQRHYEGGRRKPHGCGHDRAGGLFGIAYPVGRNRRAPSGGLAVIRPRGHEARPPWWMAL
jgi:hypothetical protein